MEYKYLYHAVAGSYVMVVNMEKYRLGDAYFAKTKVVYTDFITKRNLLSGRPDITFLCPKGVCWLLIVLRQLVANNECFLERSEMQTAELQR